jgi:endonuclease/exonuclease/phosphatase (EEP) superfamily protein YafD
VRVLSWNVYVGQAPEAVRRWLLVLVALTWPHVIVLQEAKRFTGTLPGYRRYAADDLARPDAANCVVLVRKDRRVTRERPLPVPEPAGRWTFREPKPARVFYTIVVDGWLQVVDLHRCVWGQLRNRTAWEAEDDTLTGCVHDEVEALAMVGDWNDRPQHVWALSPRSLATRLGGRLEYHHPRAIDYALVRGCRARVRKLPRKYGSDHAPKLVTLRRVRG